MKINKDNFYEAIEKYFIPLSGEIEKVAKEDFEKVFGCSQAKENSNIVYIWRCEKNIKRLKGESNIVYIGQTKQSFKNRYLKYAKNIANDEANKLKYEEIIENYGPIKIMVCDFSKFGENLQKSEGQLLWWYFQNHCEYPPSNYTKTTVRTAVKNVDK